MSHPFELRLSNIRESLLAMASLTGRNLSMAVRSLMERDDKLARQVEEADAEVDRFEVAVDDMVITHMSTHGPVASDSRLMLIASKISSHLERIADQATTIARRARRLHLEPPLTELPEIPLMAAMTQQMLQDAVTAFVENQSELAHSVIPRDAEIDELNRQVSDKLIELMMASPENVTRSIHLITIAKAIERAADHVQNIAEEVFYLSKGEDIRHSEGAGSGITS